MIFLVCSKSHGSLLENPPNSQSFLSLFSSYLLARMAPGGDRKRGKAHRGSKTAAKDHPLPVSEGNDLRSISYPNGRKQDLL